MAAFFDEAVVRTIQKVPPSADAPLVAMMFGAG